MAKMRLMMVEVEGDEATIHAAIRAAVSVIDRRESEPSSEPAALPEAPPAARSLAACPPPDSTELVAGRIPASAPSPEPEPAPPPCKTHPSRKKWGRRVIIEGVDGTHTKAEAAAILGVTPTAVGQACSPSGQKRGYGAGGKQVRYADDADSTPRPRTPSPERYESRPRGNGESMPINPYRRGGDAMTPKDPEPSHGPKILHRG